MQAAPWQVPQVSPGTLHFHAFPAGSAWHQPAVGVVFLLQLLQKGYFDMLKAHALLI